MTKRTANLRAELYDKFTVYLESARPAFSVDSLAREYPSIPSEWVAEFATQCYLEGRGQTRMAEAPLAIMVRHGALRQSVGAAWRLMRSWQLSEPADLHPPCPMRLLTAMVGTALAWSWLEVATTWLVGFFALLRPTEYLSACFRDQALQTEHAAGLFLDEPTVVEFLRWRAGRSPSWMPIYSGSAATWRRRLDILTRTLTGKSRLTLPASLRPGAATYFFEAWGENVPTKTLEHYIQELVPYRILAEVAPALRDRRETLANMSDENLLEVMGRIPA